jgi:hypothetical protein
MLFHNMNNIFSGAFVSQMFSGADAENQAWLRLALWGLVALVVVMIYGPTHLSRTHQKREDGLQPQLDDIAPAVV